MNTGTIYYKNYEFVEISSTLEISKEQYDAISKYCEDFCSIDFMFELIDDKIRLIHYDPEFMPDYRKKVEKYPEIKNQIIL